LSSVDQIALSRTLLDKAGGLDPPSLRSLDAIHLASAQRIATDLTAFVAYDTRLLEAAAQADLPTATPGWSPS
jgi:predicted nucleic acid-binding protein